MSVQIQGTSPQDDDEQIAQVIRGRFRQGAVPVYAAQAHAYLAAGWPGVLPLPPERKGPPPSGFTGNGAPMPTRDQVHDWVIEQPDGNLALRLPENVVGIDVDDYGDKAGAATLARLEAELGRLPLTVVSTSREGPSGIRFFQVPAGFRLHDPGGGIEVIQHGHRYAVAWPSIHPETGEQYRLLDQRTGEVLAGPPKPDVFPELPSAWADHLTIEGEATAKAEAAEGEARAFLASAPDARGEPCKATTTALVKFRQGLSGGAHRAGLQATGGLMRAAEQGHAGAATAMAKARAEFLDEVTNPDREGSRTLRQAEAEWSRMAEGGHGLVKASPSDEGDRGCRCGSGLTQDESEEFWNARPELLTIRDYARASRVSPWAVLAGVLLHINYATPPNIVLPATRGVEVSLNLFVACVGSSGAGKDAGLGVGYRIITVPNDDGSVNEWSLGSGEGLLSSFVHYVPGKQGEPGRIEQHETRTLFNEPEVSSLAALKGRNASTLMPALLKAYMGQAVSYAYKGKDARLAMDAHTYRATLVVGVQPEKAEVLLDDVDSGTPQRFGWLPAWDQYAPKRGEVPERPERLGGWWPPSPVSEGLKANDRGLFEMPIPVEAVEAIHAAADDKLSSPDANGLDGHAVLNRLKWAAALALLDRRLAVTTEDWELSGVVQRVSDETRRYCQDVQASKSKRVQVGIGQGEAHRELAKAEKLAEMLPKRVARRVLDKMDKGEDGRTWKRKELRSALRSDERQHLDDVMANLTKTGQVEPVTGGQGGQWRRP